MAKDESAMTDSIQTMNRIKEIPQALLTKQK